MIAAAALVSSITVVVATASVTVVRRGLMRVAIATRPETIGLRHRGSGRGTDLIQLKPLRHLYKIYSQRRHRRGTRWPTALSLMAREVRSGSSLPTAMAVAADAEPTLDGLAAMVEALRFGSYFDPEVITPTPEVGDPPRPTRRQAGSRILAEADDRLATSALRVLLTDGGRISAGLDRAADAIRERHTIADQRDAQAAQARMSARVLGALAPGFALWTVSTDDRVRSFLLGSIPGLVCAVAGLGLSAAGYWWMRRIVDRA